MGKKLYVIDGHAQIYAAYYAPMSAHLTSPSGEPTKAVYVFTTMLLKIIKQCQPDMVVMTMDSAGPTFRHEMYAEYKANRPAMPDDLSSQIDKIERILGAMRIPVIKKVGFEADDIIGTLVKAASGRGCRSYICSKDKDLEQLIDENTLMYDPRSETEMDAAGLMAKKGITPEQVIDVLTLEGDTSDNIPGVADVGPKTALQWIQKYGSLDGVLENKEQIKGKRGENLRNSLEQLELSRKLVTIDRDVPLEFNWEEFQLKPFNRGELEQIFVELGFKRLLVQMGEMGPPTKVEAAVETAGEAAGYATGKAAGETAVEAKSGDSVVSGDSEAAEGGGKSENAPVSSAEAEIKPEYYLIDSEKEFDGFLRKLKKQKAFALDTETTSVNPVAAELVGMSFCWEPGEGYYLPVKGPLGQKCLDKAKTLKKLGPILTDAKVKKTGQNIKYDAVVLRRAGIELAGVDFDTMVASYILHSYRAHHNMDSLAEDFLGHETIKLEALIGKGKNQLTFDMVDTQTAVDYAAEDAVVTWRLRDYFESEFAEQKELRQLFEQIEMPLVEVLAEMEYNGVALDVGWLKKLNGKLAERLDELTTAIYKESGCTFNVDSPKQVSEVLFDKLGLESSKKTKSGRSTDQEVLEGLSWQSPVAKLMLEYRQLSKLKNTYVDKLPGMINPDTRRVHASFNQAVAATGRLSSSNPNLQNIPIRTELGQEIRRAFVPGKKGEVLMAADYSQIELRMLAHFSQDKGLLEAFAGEQDIHRFVAAQVFGIEPQEVDKEQRSQAKAVNFGIIYGQSAFGLSRTTGMSRKEAQKFIADYFARYPEIKQFMEGIIDQAKKDGFVRTIMGRRRMIADLNSSNHNRRQLAERMAVNTVIQGSAADLIKVAMVNIHRRIRQEKLAMKMILQVHDELVFELSGDKAEPYSEIVREEMIGALALKVPITVDLKWGVNWLECK
ncbi:MAG: DNA polymerase I [Sedimentisphaerales bacterium]|nr:DNA polymerase I [Sedimentisphaerales bacterium]